MNQLHYFKALLPILLCGLMGSLSAQDVHYSQFYNIPQQMSPALAGVFDGDLRFVGNFRDQWYKVPITYRTGYGTFDTKFLGNKKGNSFFGGGVTLGYDHAGDSKMGTTQLALSGSYVHKVAKSQYLSVGLQLGGYQRSFKDDDLRFGEQYNGKQFDAVRGTGESFNDKTKLYGDFSAGLNWHLHPGAKRTRLDLGAALFHINEPNKSFFDEEGIVLMRKWSLYGLGVFHLADKWDLAANATALFQGPYTKYVLFAGPRYHLDSRATHEKALQIGLGYRWNAEGLGTGDAFYPAAQLHLNSWIFGLSYDINVSDFSQATGNLGGPEFTVIYTFKKVPVIDICPTCPTYL